MADFKVTLESWATTLFGLYPYKRAMIWKDILFHPHETMGREISRGSLMQGAKDIVVSSIPFALINAVMFFFSGGNLSVGSRSIITQNLFLFSFLSLSVPILLFTVLPVIFYFIYRWAVYLIARALGGSGSLDQQAYLYALVNSGFYIAYIPFFVLSFIPYVGFVFSVLSLGLVVYTLYLEMKSIRFAHGFSRGRAVATWIIASIITWIISLAVLLVLLVFLGVIIGVGLVLLKPPR